MIDLLAQAEPSGDVSVFAVTAIISAIAAGIAAVLGKVYGEKQASAVKIQPLPLPVEIIKTLATKEELGEAELKIEARINRVETLAAEDRRILRAMESKTHERIDKMAEALADMRGEVRQMNENVSRLLERQMKGGTR